MFTMLDFRPLPGLASPHLQTLFSAIAPSGIEPPSKLMLISLADGDQISCKVSTPPLWQRHQTTVAIVHGLGGSELSGYMIRLARKFYQTGIRVVRINLRGCGSGIGLNKRPYTCGDSHDIAQVLRFLKNEMPLSSIQLIGFSLGGNIIAKMAGELGNEASVLIKRMIAICPAIDLSHALSSICRKSNHFYHRYYLRKIHEQGNRWIKNHRFSSIYEYDEKITVPLWGYKNIQDYYQKCSSFHVISNINVPCDFIMAADDPFIDYKLFKHIKLSPLTKVWLTPSGGHMGYLGWSEKKQSIYWLDDLLVKWVKQLERD